MFRIGETKDFPTERRDADVWYGLLIFRNDAFEYFSFTAAKSNKIELSEKMEELNKSKERYVIIGVWRGMYRADAFVLDPTVLLKKFKTGIL